MKDNILAINSYTDDDLFVMMSFRETDKEEADRAYTVFYERYAKLIWSLCYKVCGNQLIYGGSLAEYVFSETMNRIYMYPTYNGSCKVSTWASKIAHNILISLLSNPCEELIDDNANFVNNMVQNNDPYDEETMTYEQKLLDDALNSLSDKERHILLTYYNYKEGDKHLPDNVMSELKKTYSTTSENIRQIKKRSLDKVKQYIGSKTNIVELKIK